MAEKKVSKKPAKKTSAKKVTATKKTVVTKEGRAKRRAPSLLKPLILLGGYFKGSWQELKQVRWPNRRATWSLTVAVLIFTGFFTALIVALDAGFEYILNRILL